MTAKETAIEIIKAQIDYFGLLQEELGYPSVIIDNGTDEQYFDILDGDDFEVTKSSYITPSNDGYKSVLLFRKGKQISDKNAIRSNVIYVHSKPGFDPLEYNYKIIAKRK